MATIGALFTAWLRMLPIIRIAVLAAIAACSPAAATGIGASIAKLQAEGIVVQGIQINVRPALPDAMPAAVEFDLSVANLDWPQAGLALQQLRARCPLQAEQGSWRCNGQAEVRNGAAATAPLQAAFSASLQQGQLQLELNRAPARLSLRQGGSGDEAHWQIQLRHLPLGWLEHWLRDAWPALSKVEGQLAADTRWPSGGQRPQIDYSVRDGGFDTADGLHAAAHVSLAGKLGLQTSPGGWAVSHQGQISGGEVLSGAFHARLAEQGTRLDFQLAADGNDGYRLDGLTFDDPGVLRLKASARITPALTPALRELVVDTIELNLPAAQQRYLAGLLAAAGWQGLDSSGRIAASARLDERGMANAALQLDALDLAESSRGIGISKLAGALQWQREGEAPAGSLGWQSASLYSLPLGASQTRWQSRDGAVNLLAPAKVPLLGGALEVLSVNVHPAAASGERVQASLAVHDVELAALSQALGWPRFGGKLGGAVPQLRYADEKLEMAGGLMLNVFDGTLNVTGLALERPFGVLPSLSADIAFNNLDLSLVTGTFDIGDISGRLSGHVRELRLLDWQPVAFDAQLEALAGGRISQRAVTTISSVGGGGIAAGLQARMLRLFDTFGYARLGIGCRLQNAVCKMRGLDADGAQYTLVEGRGLPRIQIVGHQGDVDWSVLVDRLKAAASGTKPVIN